jgi:hypothetical protein
MLMLKGTAFLIGLLAALVTSGLALGPRYNGKALRDIAMEGKEAPKGLSGWDKANFDGKVPFSFTIKRSNCNLSKLFFFNLLT